MRVPSSESPSHLSLGHRCSVLTKLGFDSRPPAPLGPEALTLSTGTYASLREHLSIESSIPFLSTHSHSLYLFKNSEHLGGPSLWNCFWFFPCVFVVFTSSHHCPTSPTCLSSTSLASAPVAMSSVNTWQMPPSLMSPWLQQFGDQWRLVSAEVIKGVGCVWWEEGWGQVS